MRTRWDLMPRRIKRPGMLAGGDGSTLSLDFTAMSGLDSRFTFSRSSTATVINSSGLVQFEDANLFLNSAWTDANNNPSQWTLGTGTGSITRSNESRTLSCSSQQYWWYQQPTTAIGLTYTASVEITSVSGTVYLGDIFVIGSGTNLSWYINGVLQTSGNLTLATTGRVSVVFTNGAVNPIIRMGLGTAGVNVTGSITLRYPRFQPGSVPAAPYVENTSTTAAYQAPRFDHDPTTLAPRGLLIEGSATNLVTQSSAMNNWTFTRATASTPSVAAPDGASTSVLVTGTADVNNHAIQNPNSISLTPQNYTFSVWLKAGATNFAQLSFTNSVGFPTNTFVNVNLSNGTLGTLGGTGATATISTAYPNGWYRVTLTANQTSTISHTGSCVIYLISSATAARAESWDASSASVYVFGAQLETGSGASSYIPTGASTVQRAADLCDMTGSNFSSWFQSGTPYTMLFKYSMNNPADWAGSNVDRGAGLLSASFSNPRVFINAAYRVASGSTDIGRFVRVYDSGTLDMAPSVYPAAASNTALVFAVNTNDAAVSAANQSLGTDASCTLLTGYTDFSIGRMSGTSGHLNGCIRQIKYWPTRLPNATLQSLTQ